MDMKVPFRELGIGRWIGHGARLYPMRRWVVLQILRAFGASSSSAHRFKPMRGLSRGVRDFAALAWGERVRGRPKGNEDWNEMRFQRAGSLHQARLLISIKPS
jgi:hypothetical protein